MSAQYPNIPIYRSRDDLQRLYLVLLKGSPAWKVWTDRPGNAPAQIKLSADAQDWLDAFLALTGEIYGTSAIDLLTEFLGHIANGNIGAALTVFGKLRLFFKQHQLIKAVNERGLAVPYTVAKFYDLQTVDSGDGLAVYVWRPIN